MLLLLDLEPELTASELARQLGVARQSLHGLVGELEDGGYLRRAPGASGRTRRLVLTPLATRTLGEVHAVLRRVEDEMLAGLSPADVPVLRRLLQQLLASATDDEAWLDGTQP